MNCTPLLSDCVIKFVNLLDNLVCIIELNGIEYKAKISQSDLKLVSVVKLQRIIKSNHKQIQQHYTINLTHQSNQITNTNYLIMDICYSGDIDFDEKIIFTQSSLEEETSSNKQLIKIEQLEKLTKSLQLKQTEQCNVIELLKEKINRLEQDQTIFFKYYNDYKHGPPCSEQKGELLPKNIDNFNINMNKLNGDTYDTVCSLYYNLFERGANLSFKYCSDNLLFFNFKNINFSYNGPYVYNNRTATHIIDEYLSKKNNFIVEQININTNINDIGLLILTLLKYTNYKKLLIPYNKGFDDRSIISHCKLNNIEFAYC